MEQGRRFDNKNDGGYQLLVFPAVFVAVTVCLFLVQNEVPKYLPVQRGYDSTIVQGPKYLPVQREFNSTIVQDNLNLIDNPNCVIPNLDPFHPSLKEFIERNPKPLSCSNTLPLTEESGTNLLYFEERSDLYNVTKDSLVCNYRGVERLEEAPGNYTFKCDEKWRLKPWVRISKEKTPIQEDGIIVMCFNGSNTKKSVYNNVHFFIQPWRVVKKREKFKAEVGERTIEQLSIIIMGTDSVARGNLIRHMPKTFDYLTNNLGVVDLKGFTKIGDNTMPNMAAVLAGMDYKELKNHSCTSRKINSIYDDCPFIWKDFSSKGIVTIFGEDAPWMGIFNYLKAGFCKAPTDYYLRPYFYASEKLIGWSKIWHSNVCQGVRPSISLIHNYSLSVAKELRDVPYFGQYWTSASTHDSVKEPARIDHINLDYLRGLFNGGYLNNTVFIFMSDHGIRVGDIRLTYSGMLEERLPYAMIRLPKWFEDKHPNAAQNLRINSRRLTTPFDLHETLKDILHQTYANPDERSFSTRPAKRGQSLFREISINRTCKEAGIPPHFCACQYMQKVDLDDPKLLEAASACVHFLNQGLSSFPACAKLTLNKVIQGRVGFAKKSTIAKLKASNVTTYLVTFSTLPGEAKMEATLTYKGGRFNLASEVSRINLYGNQSHCIQDHVYRKYCYCRDLIKRPLIHS